MKKLGSFEFTPENIKIAEKNIAKYPEGKQVSAIKALLDLAQRQNEGWLSVEAMDYIANYLQVAIIRIYEVATFYTMFNLKPVGKFLVQICTTTPCMLRGAYDIVSVIEKRLGIKLNETTADKLFTIKEVECLGACVNAPLVKINDNYFEDLSEARTVEILELLAEGRDVKTGSQIGRQSSEPQQKSV